MKRAVNFNPQRNFMFIIFHRFTLLPLVCLWAIAAQAQPRADWPQSDPSGSRSGAIYARRYEVLTRLVTRGSVHVSNHDLREAAVLSLQRAAGNGARLTFVDMHLENSRRSITNSRDSGDFDTTLSGTPRRGNFIPATDRLELTLTVELRNAPKRVGGRVLGQGVQYSQREEALKVGLSGRVLSIDRGTLSYALAPVWVEKQATRDRRIEADKRVTLFGVEIPILPPAARAGGSQSSTTRQLSLLQQCFDEAATQLVRQLEAAPRMPLSGAVAPAGALPQLFFESRGVDGRTVYLSGRDARALRRGDEVLLPVASRRQPLEKAVIKGVVTRAGELCEVQLRESLGEWNLDKSRPIRVLER